MFSGEISFCTCPAVFGLKAKSSTLLSARLSVKIHPGRAFIFQCLVFISAFLSMVTLDQKELLFCPWVRVPRQNKQAEWYRPHPAHSDPKSPQEAARLNVLLLPPSS